VLCRPPQSAVWHAASAPSLRLGPAALLARPSISGGRRDGFDQRPWRWIGNRRRILMQLWQGKDEPDQRRNSGHLERGS
jgi:hypothetical protein